MSDQIPIQIKEKPWGREIWFAHLAGYVGKILEVKKGARLSLQYHEQKTETQYVFKGKVKLTVGKLTDSFKSDYKKDQAETNHKNMEKTSSRTDKASNFLKELVLNPGDKYDILPYTVHRVEGLEDSIIFEVSTSQLDDVIRLADDYGRPEKGNHEALDKSLHHNHKS